MEQTVDGKDGDYTVHDVQARVRLQRKVHVTAYVGKPVPFHWPQA